jgi:hypothetical protein
MYRQAHAKSKELFQQYRGLGTAQINKHLLQIMALLLPMRRVCSGERLSELLRAGLVSGLGWAGLGWAAWVCSLTEQHAYRARDAGVSDLCFASKRTHLLCAHPLPQVAT